MSEEAARRALAEAVRTACLETATRAYEEAGMSGLCAEGRWDLALDAIRGLDLDAVASGAESTVVDLPQRGRTRNE